MNVVTKAATVTPVESQDPNGEFDIILSTADLDRDGDELHPDEWKLPLPEHITLDADHGMTLGSTVGSGRPFINDQGQLQVRGTYSSIPRGQETRTLVKEGHIRSVSVAYLETTGDDGKPVRELLNGAFVAVPANPHAVVLSAKTLSVLKAADPTAGPTMQELVQAIHDAAFHLGAACVSETDDTESGAADGANKGADTTTSVFKGGSPQESPTSDPADAATNAAAPEAPAAVPADAAELTDEQAAVRVRARAFLIKTSLERTAHAD